MGAGSGDDDRIAAERDAIVGDIGRLRGDAPDIEATLHVTRGRLERLEAKLQEEFEEAFNAGDADRAARLERVGGDITALILEVNQLIMRRIDGSPEVVRAAELMEGFHTALDTAADKASHDAAELNELAGTVSEVAGLVTRIKTLAG